MAQIQVVNYHPIKIALDEQLSTRLMSSPLGNELLTVFTGQHIRSCFQPIVDIKKRKVCGFEALTRGPQKSALFYPLNLFATAADFGCLYEMDILARVMAIESFAKQIDAADEAYLFLNVSVESVLNCHHQKGLTLAALDALGVEPSRIVIEITELQPVEDFNVFVTAINHYRKLGYKVAIDDLGSGYNGLRIWSEIRPDFVKIDRHFVTGIHKDADKRRFMETMVSLARGLKTKIVAEGVETELELRTLEALGVDFVQGFLFKKPDPRISNVLDYQWPIERQESLSGKFETVFSVISSDRRLNPDTSVAEVAEMFLTQLDADFFPVVGKGKVLGMVWRRDFMDVWARKYGQELHGRKAIVRLMDSQPIVVDCNTSLVTLSRLITDYRGQGRSDAFVVTQDDCYLGCGEFKDLLRKITDLKVESAQYANPLSGLPGNVPIQNFIGQLLAKNQEFAVIYVDVDHFKPYNDYYSFEQGDGVIRMISEVLKESVSIEDIALENMFIGHIGGDDFILVLQNIDLAQAMSQDILHGFQQRIGTFYLEQDRLQGGIHATDRNHEARFFPMMSLSLGVLLVRPNKFSHTQMLASYATKAKKGAKAAGGNSYFIFDSAELTDLV
ncbi:GGDEF domain-containing protein [Thiosulfativibrio zosterae]|uniref:GGDEF domain-containing protein n=1 Tax=Thiosulfativibrio zosterae TaxID=2675053 RepID=A0A6F8PL21_9GAMM|nr:bifunctional diguanylate cyclase/phosphodiesterase [Thiosulfativibrio zosterae]BBP42799.1 GGDEF domain-containing protein [Thiosulfativibrio zosterae]